MPEQEDKFYPEEIIAAKEGLYEVLATFKDGATLEKFYNPKNGKEPSRVYARNPNGDLIGFADLEGLKSANNLEDIKMLIAYEFHIAVTDEEAKKVAAGLRESPFQNKGKSE